MYLIRSEIFLMAIRSFGTNFSISGQWIATTILLGAAPTAFENIGYKFRIVLIISRAVYGALVYFLPPETKGRTLDEISTTFDDPVGLTDVQHSDKGDLMEKGDLKEKDEQQIEYSSADRVQFCRSSTVLQIEYSSVDDKTQSRINGN